MTKSVIEKYELPKKLGEGIYSIFEGDPNFNEVYAKYRLTYLYVSYFNDEYTSCWHHNAGVSLVIDTDEEEIYLIGLKNDTTKAKKDLEFLMGKSLKLIGDVSKVL